MTTDQGAARSDGDKLLVVEDDHTMVDLLTTLLRLEGYHVVGLSRREAVLPTIEEQRPSLVLMDVHLGGKDTLEVVAQARSLPGLANLRFVMTSGMELSERCRAAGADVFLLKPFSPDKLLKVLKDLLAEKASDGSSLASMGE